MKRHKKLLLLIIYIVLCVILYINLIGNFDKKSKVEEAEGGVQVITVWQVDSFEGGKGSRAEYIRKKGEEYAKENSVYIDVVAVTADAVRNNLKNGTKPDIISYGSGMYGLESYLNQNYETRVWCRGGYCILSIDNNDFSSVTNQNTIINIGKDNFTSIAALLCGLNGADTDLSTNAYVKLVNGKYKFLLGTQRDVVRLQTRGVNFYVQPITCFNDLYQNLSVMAETGAKGKTCSDFIDYITGNCDDIASLSLFCDGISLYDSILHEMEELVFEYTIPKLISEEYYNLINKIIKDGDADKLKSLLKLL